MIRKLTILSVVLVCAFGIQDWAQAATTGKIAGRVMDTKGDPLPGANVVITGTNRGATADAEGYYIILLVQPGTHSMEASLVGYQKVVQQDVKVVVGYTTTVDFRLQETVLEAEELIVTAQRPPVEPDKTASKYYVTADEIDLQPVVKDAQAWAGLQPGVQKDGRSVRQGNFNMDEGERQAGWYTTTPKPISLTYTVDGVRMVNNDQRAANLFTGVNRASIQEISVVTGVPEAEYGNMDAGIINIVTREGGRDYHGFFEYRYTVPGKRHYGFNAYDPTIHLNQGTGKSRIRLDDPAWLQEKEDIGADGLPGTADDSGRLVHIQPDDYTDISGHRVEGSFSGPLGNKASFHVSAQTNRQPVQRPNPALQGLPNYQMTGKLTFGVKPNINLKVGGVYGTSQSFRNTRESALSAGRDLFLPANVDGAGKEIEWNSMLYAYLTHSLSSRTLYELRLSRSDSEQDTSGMPIETFNVVRDHDRWFTATPREVLDYRLNRQTRHNLKFDFSSQVTKGNFFKAGAEATWFQTYQWESQSRGTSGSYRVWSMYDYYESAQNRLGADGQMDFVPATTVNGVKLPDLSGAGNLDDPAWNAFRDHPRKAFQLGAYAQDKMEFEGMVVNMGVRLDAFNHGGQTRPEPVWSVLPQNRWFSDADASLARQGQTPYPNNPQSFPTYDGLNMFKLSPRFGVSHPITARSAIHFSYGRFFVLPVFYSMYGQTWQSASGRSVAEDLNADGRYSSYEYYGGLEMGSTKRGSTNSRPGSTVNYEVGVDWNFVSDYTANATMFYRRTEDYLQQNNTFLHDPVEKQIKRAHWYQNAYSGETRGLELAVSKRFSNFFSFRATWSWYWEQNNFYGGREWVSRWYVDSDFLAKDAYRFKFEIDQTTGERIWQPLSSTEVDAIGMFADQLVQQEIDANRELWITEKFANQVPDAQVGFPWTDERNIAARIATVGSVRGPANMRDATGDGSITFLFATPEGYGPEVGGSKVLSDLNVNLVLRIEPGTFFRYSQPTPAPSTANKLIRNQLLFTNPTAFRTDLGIQKGFRIGKLRPTVFFEATNLFNAKKPRSIRRWNFFHDIPKYGLAENQPTPVVVRDNNQIWDQWNSYTNRTREIYFGVRTSM